MTIQIVSYIKIEPFCSRIRKVKYTKSKKLKLKRNLTILKLYKHNISDLRSILLGR